MSSGISKQQQENLARWIKKINLTHPEDACEPAAGSILSFDRLSAAAPKKSDAATTLNHLADQLVAMEKYAEAESLYRRSLEITEDTFGPDHLKTANCLSYLAILLRITGDHAAAEPLYRRACAIWSKVVFSPNHIFSKINS
jgi:tetratricopeptide (TPR) repeat protein